MQKDRSGNYSQSHINDFWEGNLDLGACGQKNSEFLKIAVARTKLAAKSQTDASAESHF